MSTTWKQKAAEAIKAGYMAGNGWEEMLRRHLTRCRPDLVKELQASKDLEAYLQVKTWDAMEFEENLLDSGTDPHLARQLTMEELLSARAPEEEDRPERFEVEDSLENQEAAAMRALAKAPTTQ
jgi:hypothetical protein